MHVNACMSGCVCKCLSFSVCMSMHAKVRIFVALISYESVRMSVQLAGHTLLAGVDASTPLREKNQDTSHSIEFNVEEGIHLYQER